MNRLKRKFKAFLFCLFKIYDNPLLKWGARDAFMMDQWQAACDRDDIEGMDKWRNACRNNWKQYRESEK